MGAVNGGERAAVELSMGDMATRRTDGASTLGRIDQYELLSELGGGGFGTVYLAKDVVSGIEVAVKGLPPFVRNNREEMENIRSNFALVSRLTHTNIAKALVLHLAKDVSYSSEDAKRKLRVEPGDTLMVMEYAPGITLSQWRKRFPERKVPVDKAIAITRQIASALDYAHGRRIVHRDIKPANIMVETSEGGALTVRVLDFGLAAEIRSSMGRVSLEIHDTSGTRPYMAPEQWSGGRQGPNTDQYSLAVLFHELVTGDVPFASVFDTGDPVVMKDVVVHEAFDVPPDMPKPMCGALVKALSKKPGDRFASCSDFVHALEGKDVPVNVAGPQARIQTPIPEPKPHGNGCGVAAVIAVIAVAAALAGAFAFRDRLVALWKSEPTSTVTTENPVELALDAFRRDDYQTGYRHAMKTDRTHPKLQCYIGMCYDQKEPRSKDMKIAKDDWTAKTWYEKSAAQGDVRAMTYLGVFYENGRGCKAKDYEKAKEWFRKAAEKDYPEGRAGLSRVTEKIEGLKKELRKQYESEKLRAERVRQEAEAEAERQRKQQDNEAAYAKKERELENKRAKGYVIETDWQGNKTAVWKEGVTLPQYPHWITTEVEGKWRVEAGYVKIDPQEGGLSPVAWKPGWMKSRDADVMAGNVEGTWLHKVSCLRCGGRRGISNSTVCTTCDGRGQISQSVECSSCGGSKCATTSIACGQCRGSRLVSMNCGACGGSGGITCQTCGGRGQVPNPAAAIGGIVNAFGRNRRHGPRFPSGPAMIPCSSCRGNRYVPCRVCGGQRVVNTSCPACSGRGVVPQQVDCKACGGRGSQFTTITCPQCQNGRINQTVQCPDCQGEGTVWK